MVPQLTSFNKIFFYENFPFQICCSNISEVQKYFILMKILWNWYIDFKIWVRFKFSFSPEWQTVNSSSFNYFQFSLLLARATAEEEGAFLEEIGLIKSIGFHKNIINVIGASTMMKPLFLVLEYMSHGDLLHYLRKKRTDVSFHWVLIRLLYYQIIKRIWFTVFGATSLFCWNYFFGNILVLFASKLFG